TCRWVVRMPRTGAAAPVLWCPIGCAVRYRLRRLSARTPNRRPDPNNASDAGSGTTAFVSSLESVSPPPFGERTPPWLPSAFKNATRRLTRLPLPRGATSSARSTDQFQMLVPFVRTPMPPFRAGPLCAQTSLLLLVSDEQPPPLFTL